MWARSRQWLLAFLRGRYLRWSEEGEAYLRHRATIEKRKAPNLSP
jgi:hypothetical protein